MADGREKYWYGNREDVKESNIDQVDDGLMKCEECVESNGWRLLKTDSNGRGLEIPPSIS
jgi:hypothetical protein